MSVENHWRYSRKSHLRRMRGSQIWKRQSPSYTKLYLQAGIQVPHKVWLSLLSSLTRWIADMAATMERLEEYRSYNNQFCKRILDFFTIMFTAQTNMLLGDTEGLGPSGEKGRLVIIDHRRLETYLGRYCGLMLYLKEMDEPKYSKICAVSIRNVYRPLKLSVGLSRPTFLRLAICMPNKLRLCWSRIAGSSGKPQKRNLNKVRIYFARET